MPYSKFHKTEQPTDTDSKHNARLKRGKNARNENKYRANCGGIAEIDFCLRTLCGKWKQNYFFLLFQRVNRRVLSKWWKWWNKQQQQLKWLNCHEICQFIWLFSPLPYRSSPLVYFYSIFFFLAFVFAQTNFWSSNQPLSLPCSLLLAHAIGVCFFYSKANFCFKSHKRHPSAATQVTYARRIFFFTVDAFFFFYSLFFHFYIIIFIIYLLYDHISLDIFRGKYSVFSLCCNFPVLLAIPFFESVYGLESVGGRKFEHWRWKTRKREREHKKKNKTEKPSIKKQIDWNGNTLFCISGNVLNIIKYVLHLEAEKRENTCRFWKDLQKIMCLIFHKCIFV